MTNETKEVLMNRVKSFLWRAGGFVVVALSGYVLQVGDVYKLEPRTLINLAVLTFLGLLLGELTKLLNSNTELKK